MKCPVCLLENPPESTRCERCAGALDSDVTEGGGRTADSWEPGERQPGTEGGYGGERRLQTGAVVAGRYGILRLIGEGGMGAVFIARDQELDRVVVLKVIRPELASRPEVLRRFKQELKLAREVTHENVVRIYDLGQDTGLRFITMEYIEGRDLKTVLAERGKLPPDEAASIIRQVCRGLHAAHTRGIVHRDLKPANIMIDLQGNARVMDFGIAHSMSGSGLTQTREVLGTPEYMSPEQVRGQKVDPRSDLFSVGIIFYELLTGKTPFEADSVIESLLKRTQVPARPPIELEPKLPPLLNAVVMRCLQIDPQARYQDMREILRDLETRRTGRVEERVTPPPGTPPGAMPPAAPLDGVTATPAPSLTPAGAEPAAARRGLVARVPWKIGVSIGAVLLVAAAGLIFRGRFFSKAPASQRPVTVLVSDFENATNDPLFDGTLEPALILAMEGSSFISSYPPGEARKDAAQIKPGATRLDEPLALLVAVRQGIDVVVSGSIRASGAGYQVSVKALQAATGKPIQERKTEVRNKAALLNAVGKIAMPIREALGDAGAQSAQMNETFTSGSLEAAHAYAQAQELQRAGKSDDAIRLYSQAISLDPEFGRAYAGLATTYANLGQRGEAEKFYQAAMSRIDRMTAREKYRTRGGYYLFARNYPNAIEEFAALVKQYPADTSGYSNLALAYFYGHNYSRAIEEVRRVLEISPRNTVQRNNLAWYAIYASDFETAAKEARAVIETNPQFPKAYLALGLAELAQAHSAQAAETYQRLEATGVRGASLAAVGLADLASYEGRLSDAAAILEKGLAADQASKNASAAAHKLAMLCQAYAARGTRAQALAVCDRAVAESRDEGVSFMAALAYLQLGAEGKARAIASLLGGQFAPEAQAYSKLVEAEAEIRRKNAREAIRLLRETQKLADLWLGRFALARAYLEVDAYTEAYSELEACLKRRGEATAAFLDDLPTYRFFPPIYYYLARTQEGLKSSGAAESYRTFLSFKQKDQGDALAEDARHRTSAR